MQDTTASVEKLNQVLRESGEFTQDGAGKGESSRAPLARMIDEALWLLTKAEDE